MASALHCLAFLFLLLTFLAIAISFSCPEWVMKPDTLLAAVNLLLIRRPKFTGLWLLCGEPSPSFRYGNCEWLFANDFRLQKQQPDWFLAVQILFSLALGISALAVIFGSCAAVCRKTCRGFSVTCGFLNLTFLLLVASVALFWAEAHYKWDVRPTGNTLLLGWCFWLALAATGTSLISTIMYYFLSRRDYRASY